MAHVFSIPIDDLIQEAVETTQPGAPGDITIAHTDVAIIGSGYGASVAAMNVAGLTSANGDRIGVLVLERGREHSVGEFPNTVGELPGHVRFQRPSDPHPTGNPDALFDLRLGEDVDILLGNGLGGGSLINANVAEAPEPAQLDHRWPARYRDGGLDHAIAELQALLGVCVDPLPVHRFEALKRLEHALGAVVRRASVTVTRAPAGSTSLNAVGIRQPACTDCGNCVTGCNIGSKNTLMMNLIPLAASRGARFVTGANVLTVERVSEPGRYRWRIRTQRTGSIRTPLEDEHFMVEARYVVLAAGALGSTEILQRSSAVPDGIALSEQLGKRFSTNGDGLGFSFGRKAAVNGLGTPEIHSAGGPGPTISAIMRGRIHRNGRDHPFTVEDAAVPASLIRLFGEVTTTGAALGRLGTNRLPAWFDRSRKAHDPLAYNPAVLPHGQTLLMMSDDDAARTLSLSPAPASCAHLPPAIAHMHRQLRVGALTAPQRDVAEMGLRVLDDILDRESCEPGLDGGQYVANPLWRLLPTSAASVLNGTLPGGRALSVHPLGGCGMSDSPVTGVVNDECQVFRRDGGLHPGLYVMDGAVMPGALATNPFLTIAAVAWCASESLVKGPLAVEGWVEDGRPNEADQPTGMFVHHPGNDPPRPARLIIREQMLGQFTGRSGKLHDRVTEAVPDGGRLFETDGLILRFVLQPIDVYGQFAKLDHGRVDVDAKADLFVNPVSAEDRRNRQLYRGPTGLEQRAAAASGTARIALLEPDSPGWFGSIRALRAVAAYLLRRSVSLGGDSSFGWFARLRSFWKVARMHANYRQFRYDVSLRTGTGSTICFTAYKRIRWAPNALQLWDSLLTLPIKKVRIQSRDGTTTIVPAHLRVDASYLLDQGLIQAAPDAPDTVETVLATASFLGWITRCMLQTSFWEFGSPSYPKADPVADLTPPDLRIDGAQPIAPVRVSLPVHDGPNRLDLELVRYPQAGSAQPVLLVHGLAQGSGIFNTTHMDRNLAGHLWQKGYDIWLLDYRLSNRFDLKFSRYSLDAIAQQDITEAVKTVYARSGDQPVKIFAHCVGAVGVQMAILRGSLKTPSGKNLVESVCFNAIHPWVVPSAANLVRFRLGAFVRTWITDELLDPVLRPADKDSALRSTMDRLAFSLARIAETGPRGSERHGKDNRLDNGICDRMTFLYGRMWRHGNLDRRTHGHWHELVGRAPIDVYQQLYYLIERERILDDDGENTYLTRNNLLDHWSEIPTFFLHGDRSDVFNPQSATRSAFRLNKLLRDHEDGTARLAPVYLRRIPGYGHMDPILGKTAHQDSYPTIARFFSIARNWHYDRNPEAAFDPYSDADDPDWPDVTMPETGEILRAAWIDHDRIHTRHWLERYRFNTTPVIGTLDLTNGTIIVNTIRLEDCEPWFVWIDRALEPQRFVPSQIVTFQENASAAWSVVAPLDWTGQQIQNTARILLESRKRAAAPDNVTFAPIAPAMPIEARAPAWHRNLEKRLASPMTLGESFSFLAGSCRYPGTPVERDNADSVFSGMLSTVNEEAVDLVFFIGDQIYADAYADLLETGEWRERYRRGYQQAFGSRHLSSLMKSLPVHFAVDDHEIVDNFSGTHPASLNSPARSSLGPQALTPATIHRDQVKFAVTAARSFMNSAREHTAVGGAPPPAPGTMWYALDHTLEVTFPAFVLDTRTQRQLRRAFRHHQAATYPHMMDQNQRQALADWLSRAHQDQPARPKFVFAGQIIAPLRDELLSHPSLFRLEDGFFGYPATLSCLMQFIVENQITDIVFVGGDLHLSCAAQIELTMTGYPPVTAWQIVASGLYAPLPFANAKPANYTWMHHHDDMLAPTLQSVPSGVQIRYRTELLTEGRPHFLQVNVHAENPPGGPPWRIDVAARDASGGVIAPAWPFDETAGNIRLRFV